MNITIVISADSNDEVARAAAGVRHAVQDRRDDEAAKAASS